MAVAKTKKSKKPKASPDLTFELFAPGMTPLHRAGLGGLAATLLAMERRRKLGLIAEDALPGDWSDGEPWTLEADRLTLHFGEPEHAGEYLRRLFGFAFGLKDKLIDLPGTYRDELSRAVRLELQIGLTLTFLQYGKHRKIPPEKEMRPLRFDLDGDGIAEVEILMQPCTWYLHQNAMKELNIVESGKYLTEKSQQVNSAFNPGAVVRHESFKADCRIEHRPAQAVSACFAIVGCLSLRVRQRKIGVLLIPEVSDLKQFAQARPRMTPKTLQECRIAGASDAALQAQIRLRSKGEMHRHGLTGIHAMRLRPTQWNEKQKVRVAAFYVPAGEDERLSQFDFALGCLPPRIRSKEEAVAGRRGRKTASIQRIWYWIDSIVRPLIADNLASGHRWYQGFHELRKEIDRIRKNESEGLREMIENIPWTDRGEPVVVHAVHQAMRQHYGQIADQYRENPSGAKNRFRSEFVRWRLLFGGAKTVIQFRKSLCDFFARAGFNEVLQKAWRDIIPMLSEDRWELARDLSLLALVSYRGEGTEVTDDRTETESDTTDQDS